MAALPSLAELFPDPSPAALRAAELMRQRAALARRGGQLVAIQQRLVARHEELRREDERVRQEQAQLNVDGQRLLAAPAAGTVQAMRQLLSGVPLLTGQLARLAELAHRHVRRAARVGRAFERLSARLAQVDRELAAAAAEHAREREAFASTRLAEVFQTSTVGSRAAKQFREN